MEFQDQEELITASASTMAAPRLGLGIGLGLGHRLLSSLDFTTFEGTLLPSTAAVNNTTTPFRFNFIHIPKTAGDSVMQDSPDHMLVGQTLQGNREASFLFTQQETKWKDDPLQMALVFLRDPMSHVLSQFLECKYDGWGQRQTNNTGFPGYGKLGADAVLDGFEEWIAHFADDADATLHHTLSDKYTDGGGRNAFHCYSPWNMQSRYLAVVRGDPPQPHYTQDAEDRYPSLEAAKTSLQDPKLILGITEQYSASMCLLEYHAMQGHLTRACRTCDFETHSLPLVKAMQHHDAHSVPRHSLDMITNPVTIEQMRNLTAIDQQVYDDYALPHFQAEIDMVMAHTGIDLLCRNRVQAASPVDSKTIPTTANVALALYTGLLVWALLFLLLLVWRVCGGSTLLIWCSRFRFRSSESDEMLYRKVRAADYDPRGCSGSLNDDENQGKVR